MPRQKDLNEIPTSSRQFIKSADWGNQETRNFFYTGYEKVERISKNSGNPYVQYLIYLLPVEGKGVGEELTLALFPNQAAPFKDAGVQDYQEIKVTKVVTPGKGKYENEDYEVEALNNILPEDQRPKEADYPEMKQSAEVSYAPKPETNQDEVNIDDIPF